MFLPGIASRLLHLGVSTVGRIIPTNKSPLEGSICVIKCEGYVLFVRHTYRDPDQWECAGGRRKEGESPLETIIREILEELGIKLSEKSVIDHGELMLPNCRLYLFEATVPTKEVTLESREIAYAKWFPERRPPARIGPGALEAWRRACPRKRSKKT